MEFFHCNVCFTRPASVPPRKFYLSNCGHSFCSQCFKTESQVPVCAVCKAKTEILEIKKNAPLSVTQYFGNTKNNFLKIVKCLCLQNAHCAICIQNYYIPLEKALAHTLRETERYKEQEVALKVEIAQLNETFEKMKLEIDFKRSALISSSSCSPEEEFRKSMTMGFGRVNYLSKAPTPATRTRPTNEKSPWIEPHSPSFRTARDMRTPAISNLNRPSGLERVETSSVASSVPSFWRERMYTAPPATNRADTATSYRSFTK